MASWKPLLNRLKQEPANWPSHVHDLLQIQPNFTELSVECIQQSKLRKRKSSSSTNHGKHDIESDKLPTLGHPEARGCRACFELGVDCPLLDDSECWPCHLCVEAEEDCELIQDPARKRACERCRKRRIVCSFKSDPSRSGACQQCEDKGFKCVAGPQDGKTRVGPSLELGLRRLGLRHGGYHSGIEVDLCIRMIDLDPNIQR